MGRNIDIVDLASGLLLIATALLALTLSWPLRVGTALEMGAGYVPRLLCYLQIALGVLIVAQSLIAGARRIEPWAARPMLWVLAGVTFFALALERFGLVIAVMGLVMLSCLAHRGTRLLEALLLSLALAAFSVVVFVTALRLPIPVWPQVGS